MRSGIGLLAALFLAAPSMAATIFVSPGDNGTITFPLQDLPASADIVQNVKLQVVGAPTFFTVTEGSILGPASVSQGNTQSFVVNYAISATAPNGQFSVPLTFKSDNADLSNFAITVQFIVSQLTTGGDLNVSASTTTIDPIAQTFVANLAIDLFDPAGIASATLTQTASPSNIVTNLILDNTVSNATARATPTITAAAGYTLGIQDSANNPLTNDQFLISSLFPNPTPFIFDVDPTRSPATQSISGLEFVPPTDGSSVPTLRLPPGGQAAIGTYVSEIVPTHRPGFATSAEFINLGTVINATSISGLPNDGLVQDDNNATNMPHLPDGQPVAQRLIEIRTADTMPDVSAAPYQTFQLLKWNNPEYFITVDATPPGVFPFVFKKYFQIRVTMQTFGNKVCDVGLDSTGDCTGECTGNDPISCHTYFDASAFSVGMTHMEGTGLEVIAVKGSNLSVGSGKILTMTPSAPNVKLTFPQVNRLGNVAGGYYVAPPPAGMASLPANQALSIRNEADVTGPIGLAIDYGTQSLSPLEISGLTIVRTDPTTGASAPIDSVIVSTPTHTISGTFPFTGPGNFGTFQVLYTPTTFQTASGSVLIGNTPELQVSASASAFGRGRRDRTTREQRLSNRDGPDELQSARHRHVQLRSGRPGRQTYGGRVVERLYLEPGPERLHPGRAAGSRPNRPDPDRQPQHSRDLRRVWSSRPIPQSDIGSTGNAVFDHRHRIRRPSRRQYPRSLRRRRLDRADHALVERRHLGLRP
jgi:hypothetical protein